MTKTRFAMVNGLPASAFSKWIDRVDGIERRDRFAPVRVVEPVEAVGGAPLVVELAGVGHRVLVPVDFDGTALRRLVDTLC